MRDAVIRSARESDAGDISLAWSLSFGDEESFIRSLLLGCGLISTTVVAELDGHVRSAMTAFDGLMLGGVRASYLYALCTHPEFRSLGLGASVAAASVKRSLERGSGLACLHAASPSLQKWYESLCGMTPLSFTKSSLHSAEPFSGSLHRLAPEEYMPHAPGGMTAQLLRAQELCFSPGGGFFAIEDGRERAFFCADVRLGRLCILHCSRPEYIGRAASALGFGSAEALSPASGGSCSLLCASRSGCKPSGVIFFPFILD